MALLLNPARIPLLLVVLLPAFVKLFLLAPVDLFEAHTMAVEWLTTGAFRYHHLGVWHTSYQFPVYPAIVAALLWSGVGEVGVLVFQVLCGAGSAWLIHRLGLVLLKDRPYARRVAMGAALLTGISPFLAVYQVRMVHPFAWDMLLAMALLLGSCTVRPAANKHLLAFALLAGLALLNRPTLVVFLLPWAWIHRASLISVRSFVPALVMLLLVLAPTAAWVVRNRALEGHYSLSSATGQNLWIGIQPATQGTAQLPDGRNYTALLSPDERTALAATDAHGQSAFFARKWKNELRSNPGLWWRMMGVKLRNFWLFRSHLGMHHPGVQGWAVHAFKVYAGAMLLLLVLAWREERTRLLLVTAFLFSVVQALFYVETRHRLLVEPVLLLVALAVLAHFFSTWQQRRTKRGAIERN